MLGQGNGVQNLLGLPKLLMSCSARLVKHNLPRAKDNLQKAWPISGPKPKGTGYWLQQPLEALQALVPVRLPPRNSAHLSLEEDASNLGWGETLLQVLPGKALIELASAALRWTAPERRLHNTASEALAAEKGVGFPPPPFIHTQNSSLVCLLLRVPGACS